MTSVISGYSFCMWNKSCFSLHDPKRRFTNKIPFQQYNSGTIRIMESQWALSNRRLLCHCWNYPRIHKHSFRNSTTADCVDTLLSFGGSPFLSPPPPQYCLCCPSSPADGKDWCHITIERDTKCTKCFFHPLLLSMGTLVFGGWGGAEQTFPLLTPQAVECVPNFTYSQLRQLSTCPQWWADCSESYSQTMYMLVMTRPVKQNSL